MGDISRALVVERGQKSDCSGLRDNWEAVHTRGWQTRAKSGLLPFSVKKFFFWNAAPPFSVYFVSGCFLVFNQDRIE